MIGFIERRFLKGDPADRAVRARCGTLSGVFGICCNFFLFLIKLIAGIISGSVSVTADAFNNLSDMGSSLVTVFGFRLSTKPPDPEHPFGHGRMEYMSAAAVSVLIIIVGAELLFESVGKFKNPSVPTAGVLTVVILSVSIAVKLGMAYVYRSLGRATNSGALKAAATDSRNDCISTGAVLAVSLICRYAGGFAFAKYLDPAAGLLVALFIIYSGVKSMKETLDPLIGTAPDPKTVGEIRDIVLAVPEFVGIHDMIIHNYGPGRSFVSLHAEVPAEMDILVCHEKVDRCERDIKEQTGVEAVIHMDPIVTGDETVDRVRTQLHERIKALDGGFTMHDFRMVKGEAQSNLIFDVCVPADCRLAHTQIKSAVAALASEIDPTYRCVITVDTDFSGKTGR